MWKKLKLNKNEIISHVMVEVFYFKIIKNFPWTFTIKGETYGFSGQPEPLHMQTVKGFSKNLGQEVVIIEWIP